MEPIALLLAAVAGVVHVLAFVLESVLFTRPQVWHRFGLRSQRDADVVRPMAFNQGFYNLFLAVGALAGVLLSATGHDVVGRTLVVFSCACMAGAAIVLVATSRAFWPTALMQGAAPLGALALAFA